MRRPGALLLLFLGACVYAGVAQAGTVSIKVLSNRADLVSGGDAALQVTVPAGATGLKVLVNGTRDVTAVR